MSKILLLFIGAIIAVLLLTGIVEVKINPRRYVDIPAMANSVVKEKVTIEKGRAYLVGVKRKAELFIVQDKEKRLVLSLLYVRTDAERLKELMAKEVNANALLPQAELLVTSLSQVRTNAEKAPVEVVANMKDESTKTFIIAQEALSGLQNQYEQFELIHDEFTRLTKSLEEQIGQLDLNPTPSNLPGEDNNSTNKEEENTAEQSSAPAEKKSIPLKF